ncbi:MAG: hypothetical protein AAF721_11680 [Myxococcota bacterium]
MNRFQFFVRYALPYILGLMLGSFALQGVQKAGGSESLALFAWGAVTVGFIVAWVMIKRAIQSRRKVTTPLGQ